MRRFSKAPSSLAFRFDLDVKSNIERNISSTYLSTRSQGTKKYLSMQSGYVYTDMIGIPTIVASSDRI